MNRQKRDYCSKGQHQNWKAWKAKHDMTAKEPPFHWLWQGNFCIYCGSSVDGVGSDPPHKASMGRLRVLRGASVTYADYEAELARIQKYREKRGELLSQIRERKVTPTGR